MKVLFINGSPNKTGKTAEIAQTLLKNCDYHTLNLTDYLIGSYGQKIPGDEFEQVLDQMEKADIIVIGSPLYWHNLCGSIRNLLDRFHLHVSKKLLLGRKLYFIFQGANPESWMISAGEYTIRRFAQIYSLTYVGMATNHEEAEKLAQTLL